MFQQSFNSRIIEIIFSILAASSQAVTEPFLPAAHGRVLAASRHRAVETGPPAAALLRWTIDRKAA